MAGCGRMTTRLVWQAVAVAVAVLLLLLLGCIMVGIVLCLRVSQGLSLSLSLGMIVKRSVSLSMTLSMVGWLTEGRVCKVCGIRMLGKRLGRIGRVSWVEVGVGWRIIGHGQAWSQDSCDMAR